MLIHKIDQGIAAVESKMRDIINSDITVLENASRHTINAGGKRVRPQIAILAYLAAGGQDVSEVAPIAAAIELVHTATLVHDDINDHSMVRRGVESVNGKWGRTFALLTGDYLFAKVYAMMAPYGTDFNVIMADTCVRLVEGETLQATAAQKGELDRETYKTIIARKTASLFEGAARMGAMLGGGDKQTVEALSQYAYNVGLTFQIVDDILDVVGDAEKLGKPIGLDIAQARGAMVVKTKINTGDNGNGVVIMNPVERIKSKMATTAALSAARTQAHRMADRARSALIPLPASAEKEAMLAIVNKVMDRDN
jgi:geranylgeranyl pyrophosphate synthase